MDCLRIAGGTRLQGLVSASGSKNAALPIMAASILADGPVSLIGVPELADVNTLALLLGHLGLETKRGMDGKLRIETVDAAPTTAQYDLVRRMRASFCVLGPLLAKRGKAIVSLPGGCNIGTRPVDLHLAGLAALGAEISIDRGYVIARARQLRGATIDLSGPLGPTVTGTANVMSAATLACGRTTILGAALEPEIADLGMFLSALGACITGLGTSTIEIVGVERLAGIEYEVIPDRIEAGTLLIAAAITEGQATVGNTRPTHLTAVLESLTDAGSDISCDDEKITIRSTHRPRPARLAARPYPGIPTDLQAQFMALLSLGSGTSVITDGVFPDRFMQVAELNRLGARIDRSGATATVHGVRGLSGATVMACDLRASAALVLAGLAADGETIVRRIYHLDRGYERLERKLAQLGARVTRESEPELNVDRGSTDRVSSARLRPRRAGRISGRLAG
jgi:UDP-N-acetylglucosamine 1-carboxyvinyltransferase